MSILAECPGCHRKQTLRNKKCLSCGEDLDKGKKSRRVRYWVSFKMPDGTQHRQAVGHLEGMDPYSIDDARDADSKRKIQKREHRILDIMPQAEMTFDELTKWYLKLESVKEKKYFDTLSLSLMKFNRIFGSRIVDEIRSSEIENYQAKRKKEGMAASTIDQETGAAKAVISKAWKDDKVGGNVLKAFQNIKKLLKRNSNQRKRVLTVAEFHKLVEVSAPHLKPILWAGYETGMREGEILGLPWGKVSLKDRTIKLSAENTKDHEDRVVPISDDLFEVLSRIPRGIQDDYPVFPYAGKPIKDTRTGLLAACERTGIIYGRFKDGGFIYHDLRRTFVTDMRRAGVQESVIMEITGHSRGEVFDRYNQISLEDMRRAVSMLTEYRKGQKTKVDQMVDQAANLG